MFKKGLAVALAAGLAASVALGGCSSNSGSPAGAGTQAAEAKQETKAPAAEAEQEAKAPAAEKETSGQEEGAGAEPAGDLVEFRLVSPYDTNTSMLQAAQGFVDELAEKSGGTLKGTIYAAGVMGGEQETLEAVQMGEIEMTVMGTYPMVTLAPKYGFFDAPFVFRDKEHYFHAWEGELGDGVREIFAGNNIHTVGLMGRGYRHITSNDPINSVEDLKGMKMRMGQSTPFINAFTEIGAVVVPISLTELFTSLQMGVVSASEGPFDQIYSYKLYEVQDQLALSGHLYATSLWLTNSGFYDSLSQEQKEIFDTCAEKWLAEGTRLSDQAEEELLQTLKDQGMQVTRPDAEAIRQKALPAISKMFETDWTVTSMEEIETY